MDAARLAEKIARAIDLGEPLYNANVKYSNGVLTIDGHEIRASPLAAYVVSVLMGSEDTAKTVLKELLVPIITNELRRIIGGEYEGSVYKANAHDAKVTVNFVPRVNPPGIELIGRAEASNEAAVAVYTTTASYNVSEPLEKLRVTASKFAANLSRKAKKVSAIVSSHMYENVTGVYKLTDERAEVNIQTQVKISSIKAPINKEYELKVADWIAWEIYKLRKNTMNDKAIKRIKVVTASLKRGLLTVSADISVNDTRVNTVREVVTRRVTFLRNRFPQMFNQILSGYVSAAAWIANKYYSVLRIPKEVRYGIIYSGLARNVHMKFMESKGIVYVKAGGVSAPLLYVCYLLNCNAVQYQRMAKIARYWIHKKQLGEAIDAR